MCDSRVLGPFPVCAGPGAACVVAFAGVVVWGGGFWWHCFVFVGDVVDVVGGLMG